MCKKKLTTYLFVFFSVQGHKFNNLQKKMINKDKLDRYTFHADLLFKNYDLNLYVACQK